MFLEGAVRTGHMPDELSLGRETDGLALFSLLCFNCAPSEELICKARFEIWPQDDRFFVAHDKRGSLGVEGSHPCDRKNRKDGAPSFSVTASVARWGCSR